MAPTKMKIPQICQGEGGYSAKSLTIPLLGDTLRDLHTIDRIWPLFRSQDRAKN